MQKIPSRQSAITNAASITTITPTETVKKGIQDINLVDMKMMQPDTDIRGLTEKGHTALRCQDRPALRIGGREDLHRRIEVGAHIPLIEGSVQGRLTGAKIARGKSEGCRAGTLPVHPPVPVHQLLIANGGALPRLMMTERHPSLYPPYLLQLWQRAVFHDPRPDLQQLAA